MPMTVSRYASPLLRIVPVLAVAVGAITAGALAIVPGLAGLTDAAHGGAGDIKLDALAIRSYVYAADGTLLTTLQEEENRAPIQIEDVPQHVIDAVLAVEDADYFEHKGINARATIRALVSNVESGEIEQGGSTITQQLVKQSLLTSDQDLDRKTREAFLALRLERQMSKHEILERYLNTIYFGNHAYGIQAASETYFGVEMTELTMPQVALLAGLIRDPIDYDPFKYPDVAAERRRIALRRLVEEGVITQDEADAANTAPMPDGPIEFIPPPDDYFVEEVKRRLLTDERLGATQTERFDNIFRGGLEIHTTLDRSAQAQAEAARDQVLAPFAIEGEPALFVAGCCKGDGSEVIGTVGMVSVEPSTGAVRAMVGGPGFSENSQYNVATQAFKQPGSSFKTFVLLSLLEQGYSPDDRVSGHAPCKFDIPGVLEPYEAKNFGNSRGFVGSIRSMTTASSNCGYLRLGQIAGLDKVADLAGELGVLTKDPATGDVAEIDPTIFSTPLGAQVVTPLSMAAAYATIANDGYYQQPYFVQRVLDRRGSVVFEHNDAGKRVLSIDTARIAADILKDNVLGGTGTAAQVFGHDIGGKTGTAQDFGDAWFIGFSRHLSTAIWMGGIDKVVPMTSVGFRSVTGGSYPAQIFGAFMGAYLEGREPAPFAEPPDRFGSEYLEVDRTIDERPVPPPPPPPPTPPPTTTATTEPEENKDDKKKEENKDPEPPVPTTEGGGGGGGDG